MDEAAQPRTRVTFVLRLHLEAGQARHFWRGSIEQVHPGGESRAVQSLLPLHAFIQRGLRRAGGVGLPLLRLAGRAD